MERGVTVHRRSTVLFIHVDRAHWREEDTSPMTLPMSVNEECEHSIPWPPPPLEGGPRRAAATRASATPSPQTASARPDGLDNDATRQSCQHASWKHHTQPNQTDCNSSAQTYTGSPLSLAHACCSASRAPNQCAPPEPSGASTPGEAAAFPGKTISRLCPA